MPPNTLMVHDTEHGHYDRPNTAHSIHSDPGLPTTSSLTPQYLDPLFLHKPHPTREATLDPRKAFKTIPPEHSHRTLVLCFDGTGDQFDADNSNIVQLFSMLKKDDRNKQMVYYQAGIGTYTSPQVATPIMAKISQTLDEMVAWNLDAHVMDGYTFLMQNYTAGDRICIFGFSRGAYTARSLAGMIHKIGLLPASNYQQVPFAYKMYTRADSIGWAQSNAFKKAFSIDVPIEFVGVWDTVDSVGILKSQRLPFTTSNTIVRTFRHAVSLDERRAKFKANLWNRPSREEEKLGLGLGATTTQAQPGSSTPQILNPPSPQPSSEQPHQNPSHGLPASAPPSIHTQNRPHIHSSSSSKLPRVSLERHSPSSEALSHSEKRNSNLALTQRPTDVQEVWFAGCHCDVGGGSVRNDTRYSLARISLRWMVRECFRTQTGIMFDCAGLREVGLDPGTLHPFVTPRPPALAPKDPYSTGVKDAEGKEGKEQRRLSTLSRLAGSLPPTLSKLTEGAKNKMSSLKTNKRVSLSEKSALLPPAPAPSTFKLSSESQAKPPPPPPAPAPVPAPPPIGSEEQEELNDALSPVYDQLKLKKWWWILELLPTSYRYQGRCARSRGRRRGPWSWSMPWHGGDCTGGSNGSSGSNTPNPDPNSTSDAEWITVFGSNLAQPRRITRHQGLGGEEVKVHRSVRIRMEAGEAHIERCDGKRRKAYSPRALFDEGVELKWVD